MKAYFDRKNLVNATLLVQAETAQERAMLRMWHRLNSIDDTTYSDLTSGKYTESLKIIFGRTINPGGSDA